MPDAARADRPHQNGYFPWRGEPLSSSQLQTFRGTPVGKIFISYSHDSPEHSAQVLALANKLRALGVDAEIDRYHLRPEQGWPRWCGEQLLPEVSSYVLVICTPVYRARVEGRARADEGRGVFWEGALLYNYIYNAKGNARFIPILLGDATEAGIPLPLDGQTRYRLRAFDLSDPGFKSLYRELTGQHETPKPEIGQVMKLSADGPLHVADALPEKQVETDLASDVAASGEAQATVSINLPTAARWTGFWSPFSTEESVERDEIRFWAVVETIFAMTIFWWTAIHYETFALLFTSLFVAPLLLLRSEESMRLGVKWIDNGLFAPSWPDDLEERNRVEGKLARRFAWIGAGIGAALAFGLGYPLARLLLVGHDGWSVLGRGVVFGLAMSWPAAAIAFALAIAIVGWRREEGQIASVVAAAVAAAAALAAAEAAAIAGAAAGVGASTLVAAAVAAAVAAVIGKVNVKEKEAAVKNVAAALFAVVAVFYIAPGAFLGLWVSALNVRVMATLRFASAGYLRLPMNIRRLALSMAPLQIPELVPGLPAKHDLQLNEMLSQGLAPIRKENISSKLLAYVCLTLVPFIYLPAWAYRFVLKSTLWFWWILLIAGGAPRLDGGIEGLRADAYRKATALIGIATALFALISIFFGWFLKPLAINFANEAKLPTAVALLVLMDWKSLPWLQLVSLASALATFGVVIWTRDLYIDSQNADRAKRVAAQLPLLGHLVKWKTAFGAASVALIMLYIAFYANAVEHFAPISDWTATWLHRLYGDAAERLR